MTLRNKIGVDGVGHINISSNALTTVGLRMNEFHEESFIHPIHGQFTTLVGLKCYLRTGCRDNVYRYKDPETIVGLFTVAEKIWNRNYMYNVALAYIAKVQQNPDLAQQIMDTGDTPLASYRVPNPENPEPYVEKKRDNLTIDMWTSIRTMLQTPNAIDLEYSKLMIKLGFLGPR